MSDSLVQELLSRLTKSGDPADSNSWASVAATTPDHARAKADAAAHTEQQEQEKLHQLLGRVSNLSGSKADLDDEALGAISGSGGTNSATPGRTAASEVPTSAAGEEFFPLEPTSFRDAKLADSEVEALVLKFLLARGDAAGRDIAAQIKLPFVLIEELLRQMKQDQLLFHRGSAPMNDYQFQLDRLRPRTGPPLCRTLHLLRLGAGAFERLHRKR